MYRRMIRLSCQSPRRPSPGQSVLGFGVGCLPRSRYNCRRTLDVWRRRYGREKRAVDAGSIRNGDRQTEEVDQEVAAEKAPADDAALEGAAAQRRQERRAVRR